MTKRRNPQAGGTDLDTVRAERQAALTDAERELYTSAYAVAGWAMELAELVYKTRTEAA